MEYLLKASAVIAIFYICYKLFLQRDTFFESNRWFLLIGLITAFALPFVVIPIYIEYTPAPIQNFVINDDSNLIEVIKAPFNLWQLGAIVYIIGVVMFSIRFLVQLGSLALLIIKNKKRKQNGYTFIESKNETPPFSFFKWMVYNPDEFNKEELQHIITHEKVHVKQYHSIDILISQLASIVFWFNPITWFYKKDLQQNLEFIADYKAQNTTHCKKSYQHLLLKTSVPNHQMALTNNFYNSLIKKRILMLHKSKSKKRNLFKYALVLPFLVLFLMSFNTEEVYVAKTEVSVEKLNTERIIEYDALEVPEAKIKETNTNINSKEKGSLEVKSEKLKDNRIFIKKSILKISGTITNTEGLGLLGVNILIEGKFNGVVTNFDGDYRIEAEKEDVLIFSYKGMVTQKIKAKKNKIDVVLIPDKTQVISYTDDNKIYFIDGNETAEKEFKKIFAPNFETIIVLDSKEAIKKYGTKGKNGAVEAFTKKNSGLLKVVQGNTAKNGEKPLIHLDGEEVSENVLNSIDPNKIKYVNIIKDTKAITIYGEKAKNGFVEIITEKNINKPFNTDTITSTPPWKVTVGVNATKTINGKKPLIILDDIEVSEKELQVLNKNNIASVTVLKDSDATTLYGKKAKEGVVIITTKGNNKWKTEFKIGKPMNSNKNQEEFIISGKVTNDKNLGLPGTNIIIKETSKGTVTNFDGNYKIKAAKGDKLVFSFVGMTTKEVTIKNKNHLNVILKSHGGTGLAIDAMNPKKPKYYQNGKEISQKEFKRILHDSMRKSKTNNKISNANKNLSIISGTITNKKGKPIQGAIVLNGETNGVMTNAAGKYVIKAKKGDKLIYSFKNMTSQEVEVKNKKAIDVKLTKKKN